MYSLRYLVLLVSGIIAVGQLGTNIYLPAMPLMGQVFGVSASALAMTLTVFFVGFAVANLFLGPISDRLGRRTVILAGLFSYGIGSLVCGLTNGMAGLYAGRFLQAVGASAPSVVGLAMVKDASPDHQVTAALAWLAVALTVTPAVGPLVGGYITEHLGWRANFWFLLAFTIMMAGCALAFLPETLAKGPRPDFSLGGAARTYLTMLGHRRYMAGVGAVAVGAVSTGAYFVAGPYIFIEQFHLTPSRYGLTNLVTVGGFMIGNVAVSILARSGSDDRVLRISGMVTLVGGVLMTVLPFLGLMNLWEVLGSAALFAAGLGLVQPLGQKVAMSSIEGQTGSASALLGFFQIGGSAVGTQTLGWLIGRGWTPFAAMSGVILANAILTMILTEMARHGEGNSL